MPDVPTGRIAFHRTTITLEVAPGVHRINDAYVNWYVVEDGSRLTIIDAGHPRSWRSLARILALLGRSHSDVAAVVLTHGHFDHVGFAERAHTELGVPVLVPRADLGVARRPWRYDHERSRLGYALRYPRFLRVFAAMGAYGALWVRGVKHAIPYEAGDVLDVPGMPTAIATPGHTPGHCALLLADRAALFAGDAVVTFDPYTATPGPQIVARAATADSARALRSLDAIADTGADVVLCGHGVPWRDGVDELVAEARRIGPH